MMSLFDLSNYCLDKLKAIRTPEKIFIASTLRRTISQSPVFTGIYRKHSPLYSKLCQPLKLISTAYFFLHAKTVTGGDA